MTAKTAGHGKTDVDAAGVCENVMVGEGDGRDSGRDWMDSAQ